VGLKHLDGVDDQLGLHVSAEPLVCESGGGTRPLAEVRER